MNMLYEKLPLIDLTAPRVLGHSKRRPDTSEEAIIQNEEDAVTVLKLAGLDINKIEGNIIGPQEKYMVEIKSESVPTGATAKTMANTIKKGMRKPHYTRLLRFNDKLVFQAACCLPLKIIAASLDGNAVTGRTILSSYSEQDGGKLAYEFPSKGAEMILDIKRGDSARAQRLIFKEL